jgi:glycosyltransferase involved in cell wall biosynthesis
VIATEEALPPAAPETKIRHFDSQRSDTLVVIPARNEAADVADVVRRARLLGYDVVVVDDGSTDDTARVAQESGAVVLRLPFRAGAWIAMQTGVRLGLRRGYRFTVTLDADGQHDPAAIEKLALAYERAEPACNVVVGSCVSRASHSRRIAWRFLRRVGSLRVRDLTSGYRLYDSTAMTVAASGEATLLEYQDVGVLLLLIESGCRITEVDIPMELRRSGKSRIFESWLKVIYYLLYSTMLCTSKRPLPMRSRARPGNGAGT